MYSLNVLESAIDTLSSFPDRRKSIVYIGQGLPVDVGFLAPQIPGLPEPGGASSIMTATMTARMTSQMRKAFDRATRANVNVYTVDACGLRAPSAAARPVRGNRRASRASRSNTCRPSPKTPAPRAVINTNEFEPGLSAIFDENASYYLLGFQQPPDAKPGSLRISRCVSTARTSSCARATATRRRSRRWRGGPPSRHSARHLRASFQKPTFRSGCPRSPSACRQTRIGGRDRRWRSPADPRGRCSPRRESRSPGECLQRRRQIVRVDATQRRCDAARRRDRPCRIRSALPARFRPGRYQLRIAANVGSLSTGGSLYHDIDVPDVGSTTLAISGLILASNRDRSWRPRTVSNLSSGSCRRRARSSRPRIRSRSSPASIRVARPHQPPSRSA